MGRRKGYPFSRRQQKQGMKIFTNTIFGLLGFGVCAAKGVKDAVEDSTYNESIVDKEGKSITGLFIALASAFIIPLTFLSMHIPFIGEIIFMVLFVILFIIVSEGYIILKDIGVIKKFLILLPVWIYSFIAAYMIEEYMDIVLILSFVPVLCCVMGYMNGWWKNRKTNKYKEL